MVAASWLSLGAVATPVGRDRTCGTGRDAPLVELRSLACFMRSLKASPNEGLPGTIVATSAAVRAAGGGSDP